MEKLEAQLSEWHQGLCFVGSALNSIRWLQVDLCTRSFSRMPCAHCPLAAGGLLTALQHTELTLLLPSCFVGFQYHKRILWALLAGAAVGSTVVIAFALQTQENKWLAFIGALAAVLPFIIAVNAALADDGGRRRKAAADAFASIATLRIGPTAVQAAELAAEQAAAAAVQVAEQAAALQPPAELAPQHAGPAVQLVELLQLLESAGLQLCVQLVRHVIAKIQSATAEAKCEVAVMLDAAGGAFVAGAARPGGSDLSSVQVVQLGQV